VRTDRQMKPFDKVTNDRLERRKIRLIESNNKCSYLKNLTCKGTLLQAFYRSKVPSPIMALAHCIRVYSIRIHRGKGERAYQRDG
jgi:hypothetical protein